MLNRINSAIKKASEDAYQIKLLGHHNICFYILKPLYVQKENQFNYA